MQPSILQLHIEELTMPNLTSLDKTNTASYLAEVILPPLLEASLVAKERNINALSLASTLSGILSIIPAVAGAAFAASGATAILSSIGATETWDIRLQADNTYWLEVKRQIHCTLPDSYTDPAWLRERLARSIENIVPFNNRSSLKLRTPVNAVVRLNSL
jgi:hypothetical protein